MNDRHPTSKLKHAGAGVSFTTTATVAVIDCEGNGVQVPILDVPVQMNKEYLTIDVDGRIFWRDLTGRSGVAGPLPTKDPVSKQAWGALKGINRSEVASLWRRPSFSFVEGLTQPLES